MSISSPSKIETENKQSVDNFLLDNVATADSRLVGEILCTTDCVVLLQYSMPASSQCSVFSEVKVLSTALSQSLTDCCTVFSWLDYWFV